MNHSQLIDIWKDSFVKDIPEWVKNKLLKEHVCPKNAERTMYDIAIQKRAAEKFIPQMSELLGIEVDANILWDAMFSRKRLQDIPKTTMNEAADCLANAIKLLNTKNGKAL